MVQFHRRPLTVTLYLQPTKGSLVDRVSLGLCLLRRTGARLRRQQVSFVNVHMVICSYPFCSLMKDLEGLQFRQGARCPRKGSCKIMVLTISEVEELLPPQTA